LAHGCDEPILADVVSNPDQGDSENGGNDDDDKVATLPTLTPRARSIKREIEKGTYRVDLPALADRLLDELGESEETDEGHDAPVPNDAQQARGA